MLVNNFGSFCECVCLFVVSLHAKMVSFWFNFFDNFLASRGELNNFNIKLFERRSGWSELAIDSGFSLSLLRDFVCVCFLCLYVSRNLVLQNSPALFLYSCLKIHIYLS